MQFPNNITNFVIAIIHNSAVLKWTARKRVLLLFEHIAQAKFFNKQLLSPADYNLVISSLSKADWGMFECYWLNMGLITSAFINLQSQRHSAKRVGNNLLIFVAMAVTSDRSAKFINSILKEFKSNKERQSIVTKSIAGKMLLNDPVVKFAIDNEGYVSIDRGENIKLDGVETLTYLLDDFRMAYIREVIRFFSMEKAINDFIKQKKFNIPTYKKQIKLLGDDLRAEIKSKSYDAFKINEGRLIDEVKINEDLVKKFYAVFFRE